MVILILQWLRVDIVEIIEEEITTIKDKIIFLESLQKKHLLPGFDDRGGEESSIEKTCQDIINLMNTCQKKIKSIPESSRNQSKIVGKNIQISLASKLQETSASFKKIQGEYLNKLKSREKTTTLGKELLHESDDTDVKYPKPKTRYLLMLKCK